MEILLGCVAIVVTLAFPVVAIIALVRTSSHQRRIERLEGDLAAIRANLTAEERPAPEPATPQQPPPAPEPAPIEEPPAPGTPPMEEPPPPAEEPEPPIVPPPDEEVYAPAAYAGATPAPPPVTQSSPPRPPSPALGDRIRGFDWESLIGVKLFSWIAGIALALAAVFFLKYSFERGLLQPPVRMAIGLITGLGLLILCELRVAQRYRVTANAMDAAGIAILYATLFSSYAIWGLVPGAAAFVLMIAVTAVAVALSIRRDSVFIALLGLIGGFATPAMLSSGEDHPITLFSYLLMLNAGLAWVAYRKRWPALAVLALTFTTVYQWGWVLKFLGDTRLPLAIAIFLAFPLLSIGAFFFGSREGRGGGLFGRSAAVASIVPVTFAIYLAAVPAYGEQHHLLFGFLLLVDLGLAGIAASRRAPETLHAVGAISTVLVLAIWIGVSWTPSMWPSVLGWISALVMTYLLMPVIVTRAAARWPNAFQPFTTVGERAIWAAPLLLFVLPIFAAIEPRTERPALLFGTALLLAVMSSWVAIRVAKPNLVHLAAALIVLSEAVWTANHLSPHTLLRGLAWYAIFPLLFLGVSLRGNRATRSDPRGEARAPQPWLALSAYLFLLVVASRSALAAPPWPLFAVLTLLLISITYVSWRLARPSLFAAVVVATQLVLLAWAGTMRDGTSPSTAVIATLAAAAFAVAWRVVGTRPLMAGADRASEAPAAALAGLFLAQLVVLVATQPENPPFPLILFAHAALLAGILAIAAQLRWHVVAVIATIPASAAVLLYRAGSEPERWVSRMILAGVLYAIFLAYPLILGRRAGRETLPYLAPIFMSVTFFFFARGMLIDRGFGDAIGLLPVAQAGLIGLLLMQLLRIERPGERTSGRLAIVAGVALAFVTVAVPLQLEREWVTLGWALEGAALVWLFRRIPHRGLLYWAAGLLGVVFIRLALNPAVLDYHPRTPTPILNWYLYAYTTASAAMFAAVRLLPTGGDDLFRRLRGVWSSSGTILLFLLLNIEIADYFSDGPTITFDFSAGLAQDLTYTLGWSVFAIALLIAGLLLHNRPARMAAIGLLFASVLKGFLRDLMSLGGLYRIASLVGLAIALAFVAILLQKFVLARREGAPV